MPREQAYLIQGPTGTMTTIQARSVDGAKRIYLARNRRTLKKGSQFSIKPRGDGSWTHFDVL